MNKKNLTFKKLDRNNLKNLKVFLKKYWNKNFILAKNQKLFDWQHKNNKSYNYIIAKENKVIIGVQGFIPLNKFDSNLKEKHIFLALWRVIESSNIGVGYLLHKQILELQKPKFIGVIGVNQKTHKIHEWLGFKIHKMSHHYLLSDKIKNFKIAKIRKKFDTKYRIYKNNIIKITKITKNNILNSIDNEFYKVQIPIKSNKYMINRYINHPYYKYEIYKIEQKKIIAILVTREIIHRKSKMIKIVDFIGEAKNFSKIGNFFEFILSNKNAEYLDFYSFGINNRYIEDAGLINNSNHKNIIPNHFEPFELKNVDIYCGFKNQISDKKIKIFRGDGDGDRPSILK